MLRQASTRTPTTTRRCPSPRPIMPHTGASRRRSRTASPSRGRAPWARRGTTIRASGSAAAAAQAAGAKKPAEEKDAVPTTAEKAAVLHAIAQLDGKATVKKARRAAESFWERQGSLMLRRPSLRGHEVTRMEGNRAPSSAPFVHHPAMGVVMGVFLYRFLCREFFACPPGCA